MGNTLSSCCKGNGHQPSHYLTLTDIIIRLRPVQGGTLRAYSCRQREGSRCGFVAISRECISSVDLQTAVFLLIPATASRNRLLQWRASSSTQHPCLLR